MVAEATELVYEPRGAARDLFHCQDREVLLEGPRDTGKTRAACEKLNAICDKWAGARVLIVRATRKSLTESVLVTFETRVLPPGSPLASGPSRATRHSYVYPNGSVIVVGGLDNPDRFLSTEFDVIYVGQAEEITLDEWEKLLGCLRNGKVPYQQAIADCNPAHPGHFLNVRANDGLMTRLMARHEDNPSLTPDRMATLDRLTGVRKLRLKEGKWAGSEGVVYDSWDRAVHVRERPGPWERVLIGVDDGFQNPFAVTRYGVDGDGRMHAEREYFWSYAVHGRGLSEQEKVVAIRSLAANHEAVIIDPSAASLRAACVAARLHVVAANNDVLPGIGRLHDRMAKAEDEQPRFTVDPSCVNMIREMETYEWIPGRAKDTPRKEHDHTLDEARYVAMYLDGGAQVVMSWAGEKSAEAPADPPTFEQMRADPDYGFEN